LVSFAHAPYDLKTWITIPAPLPGRGCHNAVLCLSSQRDRWCLSLEGATTCAGRYECLGRADRSNAIVWSGNGREGIFEVLLPIAYFLLWRPHCLLALRAPRRSRHIFCAASIFLLCVGTRKNGLIVYKTSFSPFDAAFWEWLAALFPGSSIDRFAGRWLLPVLCVCKRFLNRRRKFIS